MMERRNSHLNNAQAALLTAAFGLVAATALYMGTLFSLKVAAVAKLHGDGDEIAGLSYAQPLVPPSELPRANLGERRLGGYLKLLDSPRTTQVRAGEGAELMTRPLLLEDIGRGAVCPGEGVYSCSGGGVCRSKPVSSPAKSTWIIFYARRRSR